VSTLKQQALAERAEHPGLPVLSAQDRLAATVQALAEKPDVDVTKLERIIELQERLLKEQSRQAFNAAMSAAQRAMGPIVARGWNPETRSKYRKYEDIDRVIRPIYTTHGFAMSFGTADTDKPDEIRVTCLVTHAGGHEREYAVNVPSDGKGIKGGVFMTRTHATGSGLSYGKRYLADLIWNLAMTTDDDGNAASGRSTTPEPPEGYQVFLGCLDEAAGDGTAALAAAWKDAPKDLREYLAAHDPQKQKGYRAKATTADRATTGGAA
jgi:hypothetical protein